MHLSCMRINILPSVALQENGLDSDTLVLRPRLCARPEGPVRAGWQAAEHLQEFSRPCLSCSTKSQSSIHKKVFYGPFWEKMSFVDMQSSSYFLVTKLFKIPKIKLWVTWWSKQMQNVQHSTCGSISRVEISGRPEKCEASTGARDVRAWGTDLSRPRKSSLFRLQQYNLFTYLTFHLFPFEASELAMLNAAFTIKLLSKNIKKYKLQRKIILFTVFRLVQ